ncbi:MAG: cytosolic protein [Dehalococcoidia bacterium]|nr:MAG: cytosolic protein [Dehalococcoidia bacterium]
MNGIEKLDNAALSKFAVDLVRRSIMHYGIWFSEVDHQLGLEKALQIEHEVFGKLYPLVIKRLESALGLAVDNGLTQALSDLPRDKMISLINAISANWLAGDGLWFQAVESRQEMFTAKRCNDSCWVKFSPFEAERIKSLLDLPDKGGLDALEAALGYRLYSRINTQSTERQGDSLIFKMVNCRVQDARRRKGLDDYPCKSAGVVEYASFARTIDPRIRTDCIACPPDDHPDDWFCAWKFYIE